MGPNVTKSTLYSLRWQNMSISWKKIFLHAKGTNVKKNAKGTNVKIYSILLRVIYILGTQGKSMQLLYFSSLYKKARFTFEIRAFLYKFGGGGPNPPSPLVILQDGGTYYCAFFVGISEVLSTRIIILNT